MLKIVSNEPNEIVEYMKAYYNIKEVEFEVIPYKPLGFLGTLFGSTHQICKNKNDDDYILSFEPVLCADRYFLSGNLDKQKRNLIKITNKNIIVTSTTAQNILKTKYNNSDTDIIYPVPLINEEFDKKDLQNKFFEDNNIQDTPIIITFSSDNLKKDRFKTFLSIVEKTNSDNFVLVVCVQDSLIQEVKQAVSGSVKLTNKLYFIDDSDHMLQISDIFLYPTSRVSYSLLALKAMFYKSIVFVPETNGIADLLDIFAIIQEANHQATTYKIDGILNGVDIKDIKEKNYILARKIRKAYHNFLDKVMK